ncbi:MAG TPA: NAD-dependent epimerase/dehydratase family protein [Spongiibacteraceae bacterium]
MRLAAAARITGVKRFIFISTAKIFGEGADGPYRESSPANPGDAYSLSKWQAEQQLLQQGVGSAMEVVILRPPLVYGIDAGANFARLLQLARLPVPLPFAGIDNQRAMIGIDNLVDLIKLCISSPQAAERAWLCADDRVYSLASIITIIRRSLKMEPKLFRLPFAVQQIIKAMLGTGMAARLYGDFALDCSATRQHLDWSPPYSMEQILRAQLHQEALSNQT